MNYKSFTQVVILGSSSFVPFMQLTAADRRDVIEDVLDIQVFSNMNTVLKSRASLKKDEIKELDNDLTLNKDRISVVENHVEKLIQANETKIKSLEDELSVTDGLIEKEEQKLSGLLKEQEKLLEQMKELESLKEKLNKYQNMQRLITNSLNKSIERISFFEDNESCPTCTQTIHDETKEGVLEKLQSKKDEFETASKDIEVQIENVQTKIDDLTQISRKSSECHSKIMDSKSGIESSRKYAKKLTEELKSMSREENDSSIDETRKNLEVLNSERQTLIEKKEELREEGVLLGCVGNLLKDTGIKSKIIRHYLPLMNKLINKFLADMGFFAQFHLDENFNETIKSRFRDAFSYMSFSEGEKMRIDLALLLAWREIARLKNSANTNLLILDEVFDSSLDSVGTEEFMKLMSILSANTHVFVISHKSDQLVDKFENQITFVKSGNFSKVS